MADTRQTVLILGASRGLGFALAEEWCKLDWNVIATERSPSQQLRDLRSRFPKRLEIEKADIADRESVAGLRHRLEGRSLDVLFVNAGINKIRDKTPMTVEDNDYLEMILTNSLSPMRVVQAFETMVPSSGVIAIMTSELGSLTNTLSGVVGDSILYASSKAALNMLMKCFSDGRKDDPRALILMAPGWVRTDMGGPNADFSIEESIPFVVETVVKAAGTPGLRYVDRFGNAIPW